MPAASCNRLPVSHALIMGCLLCMEGHMRHPCCQLATHSSMFPETLCAFWTKIAMQTSLVPSAGLQCSGFAASATHLSSVSAGFRRFSTVSLPLIISSQPVARMVLSLRWSRTLSGRADLLCASVAFGCPAGMHLQP